VKFVLRYTLDSKHARRPRFYEVEFDSIEEANNARRRVELRGARAIVEARDINDVPWECSP
jgi:hypothetical protein